MPGGEGLARIGGVVTLVPGALPGDRVRVRVTEVSPRLVRGTLEEVVVAGEARRPDAEVLSARPRRFLRRMRLACRAVSRTTAN